MNAQGGVVRSKLHGLEKKWTYDSLDICNFEQTIDWPYAILNARKSGPMQFWTHDSLDISIFERTIVWTYVTLNAQ